MKDEADKHRAVVAAADDLQAVVAELNAGHESECPLSVHSCSWPKHGGQNTPRSSKR